MRHETYELLQIILQTFTVIGVVAGALWARFTYVDTKKKEFYTTFWNKKLELFLETSEVAAMLATASSVEEFNAARLQYTRLFCGRLSLVEGKEVKDAMKAFSRCLPNHEIEPRDLPQDLLEGPAHSLTLALKDELGVAWQKPFGEI